MESILCGVIAWNVIPRGNISREGKHFIDLVFGKKIKVKNLRYTYANLINSQLNYSWKNVMLTYHEKNFEVLK